MKHARHPVGLVEQRQLATGPDAQTRGEIAAEEDLPRETEAQRRGVFPGAGSRREIGEEPRIGGDPHRGDAIHPLLLQRERVEEDPRRPIDGRQGGDSGHDRRVDRTAQPVGRALPGNDDIDGMRVVDVGERLPKAVGDPEERDDRRHRRRQSEEGEPGAKASPRDVAEHQGRKTHGMQGRVGAADARENQAFN